MNEIIFMLLFITVLIVIYAFEKLFEKNGLLYILIILNMLSFIMSFKISNVFNARKKKEQEELKIRTFPMLQKKSKKREFMILLLKDIIIQLVKVL